MQKLLEGYDCLDHTQLLYGSLLIATGKIYGSHIVPHNGDFYAVAAKIQDQFDDLLLNEKRPIG